MTHSATIYLNITLHLQNIVKVKNAHLYKKRVVNVG